MEIGVVPAHPEGRAGRQITPTDVAQFIRLDQCERYLRLRLYQRNVDGSFMRRYGVVPQSIPPLLTRSGADFEREVEWSVRRHYPVTKLDDARLPGDRGDDNEQVISMAREIRPGSVRVLFQPRLSARLGDWWLRGDADIIRLERDLDGTLDILIADMKSTTAAKVEHRLQVAFYHEMLFALLQEADIPYREIQTAILYRGPEDGEAGLSAGERITQETQREAAERLFGMRHGLLEMIEEAEGYLGSVRDLVTGEDSAAGRIARTPFEDLPYSLNYKCDGCLFNEFCLRRTAESDDLSLLPYLTSEEKGALRRAGLKTIRELATLKELRGQNGRSGPAHHSELIAAAGKEELNRQLAATWPVGPRLDGLVVRARRYRSWKGDNLPSLPYIPSKGYGSLPYADLKHNPNLIRIYIDAQHDYLHDRIYLLGALVVACRDGEESPERRRSIVRLSDGPPETVEQEAALVLRWVTDTLQAIVELAVPDAEGRLRAPIHLVFYNRFAQRLLLEGLARHAQRVLGATPLYDFVTQLAAFDSPVASFLDQEIRELKNYPMVCQSLQAVAAYLQFDWNEGAPYRDLFRTRLFDFWGKFDEPPREENRWYTARARFNSQIPLEYAYAAWQELPQPALARNDEFASYRQATPELLRGFQARRLDAIERIAHDFVGNQDTEKTAFDLPDLGNFSQKALTLAQALDEFVTIERHVELAEWKNARLAPPERRVLSGITLLARYEADDQETGVALKNAENERRWLRRQQYEDAARGEDPESVRPALNGDQKAETKWSQEGLTVRLRLECGGVGCSLDEVLALSSLRPGERVVILPRTMTDSRLPVSQRVPLTPTPKRMFYGTRAELVEIDVVRDPQGQALEAFILLEITGSHGGKATQGFAFGSIEQPFQEGQIYTIDPDPNDWYGYFCRMVTQGLCHGGQNALYDRLAGERNGQHEALTVTWLSEAVEAQERFLAGLDALLQVGELHPFEPSKRDYLARHGDAPTLLVQGPPGTGKSYSTAFALFARFQGALAGGRDFRAFLTCKTHAATDVLLQNVAHVQEILRQQKMRHPEIFAEYFDPRLLDIPLYRFNARGAVPPGVTALPRDSDRLPGAPKALDAVTEQRWCVVATAPSGTYRMLKDRRNTLFGHLFCDCLVLDEASQMNLPEAIMAALPLKRDAQLIVVGDHRQMPPIVKHNWSDEPRRTFKEFRAYESLFRTLLPLAPPTIKFEESFRLHADMAEFLRREIYAHDGINFHSHQRKTLQQLGHPDPFVRGVLDPQHPIVVVVHDERDSLQRNPFEQALIAPVLEALADPLLHDLDAEHGLGVVVPHRAQRAALQEALPCLTILDPLTGAATRSAVDTVERFQGDERSVIAVGATESDPQYVLLRSEFLLDPRRLTVALSRARHKMILVASRSVFTLFSADEETFANAQLWKNLLRGTCTVKLWEGEQEGKRVEVWGNRSA